jgi:hypothetical protein
VFSDTADYFLSKLARVFKEEDNLSKLSAFFVFCLEIPISPHLRAQNIKLPNYFGYSIVKHQKRKGAITFKSLVENFRVTAPKTILSFLQKTKLAKFLRFGSGKLIAPAFLNLFLRAV